MKKAPPQKSAPPPSIPKEDKVEKKPIVELKAKEVTIDEKVSNRLLDNGCGTKIYSE